MKFNSLSFLIHLIVCFNTTVVPRCKHLIELYAVSLENPNLSLQFLSELYVPQYISVYSYGQYCAFCITLKYDVATQLVVLSTRAESFENVSIYAVTPQ